jgi:UDPglucose 6-dehydrogenase
MPLLAAVVETNDRLAALVSHEVDAAAHAAAGELRHPATVVGAGQERESA